MSTEKIATICLAFAVIHTFFVSYFQKLAHRARPHSVRSNLFHLLGEVEVVFGFWAGILILYLYWIVGRSDATSYLESLNMTEPLFIFVIMGLCATQPILDLAARLMDAIASLLPLKGALPFYVTTLIVGPLLGSLITEPAAMTVVALLLFERIYSQSISDRLKYATLGLLFVNISIGGVLTPYAAPPVLMVASTWGWDLQFMFMNFGDKAALAIFVSTLVISFFCRSELSKISAKKPASNRKSSPLWVILFHLSCLIFVVYEAHHPILFVGCFLFFMGVVTITKEYQSPLKLRESLLVALFLAGLVVLGGMQRWWLEPVLSSLSSLSLFVGSIGLTAITDNAALTYLGSQVPSLSDISKYALVAGAVTGGGLTVIANAPNPVGFGILSPAFGRSGINPAKLLLAALFPTSMAALAFWLL